MNILGSLRSSHHTWINPELTRRLAFEMSCRIVSLNQQWRLPLSHSVIRSLYRQKIQCRLRKFNANLNEHVLVPDVTVAIAFILSKTTNVIKQRWHIIGFVCLDSKSYCKSSHRANIMKKEG